MRTPILTLLAVVTGCGGGAPLDEARSALARITDPQAPPADVAAIVSGNTAFATALHRQLAVQPGNLVYSPYSLSVGMAMLRENIGDEAALDGALGFALPDARFDLAFDALDLALTNPAGATIGGAAQQLVVANALWSAMIPPAAYLDTLAQYYGAGVLQGADPAAAIDAWQATQPGDALPFQLIGPCDNALVDRVRFDGAWQTKFDSSDTMPADFHTAAGAIVTAPTMHLESELDVNTTATPAIEIPYDGGTRALLVVVPADLAAFEAQLDRATIDAIVASLAPAQVRLSVPKLHFGASESVLAPMQALGLPLDSGHWQIWHAAQLDVSEAGTQATGMTTVSHTPRAVADTVPFAIDRPFFFAIRDRPTGTLLFVGHVVDPTHG